MKRWPLLGWALIALLAFSDGAGAESGRSITVEVVDIAGGRAYLRPGEVAGVGVGSVVSIRDRRYRVVGATDKHIVIEMKGRELRVGMRGRASAKPSEAAKPKLPKPKPLSAYEGQWSEAVLPASQQTPEYVPLGTWSDGERVDLSLSTNIGGVIGLNDRDSSFGRASVRTRLHAEPFEQPVFFDVDFAVQSWFAGNIANRPGSSSRPVVAVRELQFGYGTAMSPQVAVGRLPFVAAGVGQLDGARVRSPSWAGFSIGAFGGTVPDPLDNLPTLDTTRFGGELVYQNPSLAAQPFVALSAHGSTYMGNIDERRLNAEFDVFPGTGRVAGHFELSLHDENNIWRAPRVEVSAAGFDASARIGLFQITGRFDMRLPERSLWLTARILPLGYLCNTVPDPASSAGEEVVCLNSDDARYFGGLDTSFSFSRARVARGREHRAQRGRVTSSSRSPATCRRACCELARSSCGRTFRSRRMRARSCPTTRPGSAPGVDIRRVGEVSAYYRASLNQYNGELPSNWLQHSAGGILYLVYPGTRPGPRRPGRRDVRRGCERARARLEPDLASVLVS